MKTVLNFSSGNALLLPSKYKDDDVRFSDSLALFFIEQYTKSGDVVFDPFVGFATTVLAAEKLGRVGYGIEVLEDRADYIKSVVKNKDNIICASALELDDISLPKIDFVLTSPPYMSKNNHPQYPFAGYEITGQNYNDYHADLKKVFTAIKSKMNFGATAVIEVSNVVNDGVVTSLAFDIANSVGEVLKFEREIVINWDNGKPSNNYGYGYDHSYCLVFKNK